MTTVHHDIILIVDDDAADIEFTRRVIEEKASNVRLMTAKNGEEALNLLFGKGSIPMHDTTDSPPLTERANTGKFWIPKKQKSLDLDSLRAILLDIHMPGIDGFDVLRIVKSHDMTKHVPVIILTSSQEVKDVRQCYALGANSYIVKPISAERYEHAVQKIAEYWLNTNEQAASSIDIHVTDNLRQFS